MVTPATNILRDRLYMSIHVLMVTAFYSLLYTIFFSPAIFSDKLLGPGDGIIQYAPAFYSPRTLWTSLLAGGFPVAADPQEMTWYPLSILFSLLPDSVSWNVFVVSAYVLASCFMYGYVYTLTTSRLAALISGIIYGMSGFMIAHIVHTTMIHAAVWMPLLLWTLEKLKHKCSNRWFFVSAFSVALCGLAGHPQIFVYTLGFGILYILLTGWNVNQGKIKYYVLSFLAIILGTGITMIQLLPLAELVRYSVRNVWNFEEFISVPLHFYHSIMLVYPYLFGGYADSFYGIPYFGRLFLYEMTGYVGILSLILVIIGFVANRQKFIAWFWVITGVLAFLLTLGDATPLAKLMFYLPGYNRFRMPARHFIVMTFAVCVLAGFGITAIQRQSIKRSLISKTVLAGAGMMIISLIFIFVFSDLLRSQALYKGIKDLPILPWDNPATVIPLLVFILGGVILIYWSGKTRSHFRLILLVSVLIIDLGSFGWFCGWRYRSPNKEIMMPTPLSHKYSSRLQKKFQRLITIRLPNMPLNEIFPNLSRVLEVPNATIYNPLLLHRVRNLLSLKPYGVCFEDFFNPQNRSFDIFSIRYIFFPRYGIKYVRRDNILWSERDLKLSLGSACGKEYSDIIEVNLPSPRYASAIAIMSNMRCSEGILDGNNVLNIQIIDIEDSITNVYLRDGEDTSELSFNCSNVSPRVRHQRARYLIAGKEFEPCEGYHYVTKLKFNDGRKLVKSIRLKHTEKNAIINIQKITLLDEEKGESFPLSPFISSSRLRFVEETGRSIIYENLGVMPRVWLVPEAVSLKPEEILHAVKTSRMPDGRIFEPSRMALVEEPFTIKASNFDRNAAAQIVYLNDTTVEIHTRSSSPAFLVLSDVYYPGWKATIDGIPTHIFQTNYVLRGVMVPSGGHVVRFKFRPKSLYIGAGISVLSILFLWGIVLVRIRIR